jgi:adenylate cyclase
VADIFLSYAAQDRDRVRPLVELLRGKGWTVWWDREIHAGPRFDRVIQDALDAALCVVVVWSENSIESDWVWTEANEARERNHLVPVLLDEVRPPLAFRSAQTASLVGWPDKDGQLDALFAGIEHCLKAAPPQLESSGEVTSIAVLPFLNSSNDPDQEFFADGIAEELIQALVSLGTIDVKARTSSFQFKHRHEDVRNVARSLGVSHVLDGSVRKAGDRVRVTAELIDGATGTHLWADRYDCTLTDIFAVQDEITTAIVQATALELGPSSSPSRTRQATNNPLAYDAYLKGRFEHASTWNEDVGAKRARPHIEEAVSLDPQFADAWAALAGVHFDLGWRDPDLEQLHFCLNSALSLDPAQREALTIQAQLRFWEEYDAQGALDGLAALIRQWPSNHPALLQLASVAMRGSFPADALTELTTRLIALDPLREVGYRFRAIVSFDHQRYEDFLVDAQHALQLQPDDIHMKERMVLYARKRGDYRATQDALERYRAQVAPDSFLAEAFASDDHAATLERLHARDKPGGPLRVMDTARAYAYLGDHLAAIAKLREFVSGSRSFARLLWARHYLLQPLLKYPEYQAVLATIGLDDESVSEWTLPSVI